MSSRGWAGLGKPLSREELRELASRLPYQRVKDSPTHPYYTDWRVLSAAESREYAERGVEPPLRPGLDPVAVLEPCKATLNGGTGVEVEELRPSGEPWRFPVEGRLDAVHGIRWCTGLRLVLDGGSAPVFLWGGNGYSGYHVEVRVKKPGSRLPIVTYTPVGGVTTATLLVEVEDGASLRMSTLNLGEGAVYFRRLVVLGNGSSLESGLSVLGGSMVHDREDVFLEGDGGKASTRAGLVSVSGEKIDSILNVVINGKDCEGSVRARGLVGGSGYLVSRGVARVNEAARNASAVFESYVTVLDEGGRGYSVPVLEVNTGDVREARHSTAVMAPPADAAFYLRQRGLSEREARFLLAMAVLEYGGVPEDLGVDSVELAAAALGV